jgi:hypothetical protein
LLYECALEPHFLGHVINLPLLGYLAELLVEFGWDQTEELVCNLAAKILGRERGAPEELRLAAIKLFEPVNGLIDELASTPQSVQAPAEFDEGRLSKELVSGDLTRMFDAISDALKARVDIDRVATTMVLLAADRMARTPANLNPGWGSLNQELVISSSVRTALRYGGYKVGARALYHAAWQFFSDRWLNISPRSITEPSERREVE